MCGVTHQVAREQLRRRYRSHYQLQVIGVLTLSVAVVADSFFGSATMGSEALYTTKSS